MIKFNRDIWGAGLFVAVSTTIWVLIPYQIEYDARRVINAQTFPRLIVGLMWICSMFLLIKAIISIIRKVEPNYTTIDIKAESKTWMMIGDVILFWGLLHWINFLVSAIVFSTIVLLIFKSKKWYYYVTTYVIIAAVYYIFELALRVNLP